MGSHNRLIEYLEYRIKVIREKMNGGNWCGTFKINYFKEIDLLECIKAKLELLEKLEKHELFVKEMASMEEELQRSKDSISQKESEEYQSVDEVAELAKKEKKDFNKIADIPEIKEVLESYGKKPSDIEDIYWTLMAAGSGYEVAYSTINDPTLLEEYLKMKSAKISALEMAYKLTDLFFLDSPKMR